MADTDLDGGVPLPKNWLKESNKNTIDMQKENQHADNIEYLQKTSRSTKQRYE